MVDFQSKSRYSWEDFLEIMRLLRAPGGCPWDAEQTHASIRRNFLEETYEALDAIDRDDPEDMCEELGDVLMQVVFHAQIETERGRFTFDDVVDGVSQKLVYRHPHVFGTVEVADSREVLVNWDALKRKEKSQTTTADAIEAVPHTLPALWRAEKIGSKTAKAGFDWRDISPALDKLSEATPPGATACGRSWGTCSSSRPIWPSWPAWTRRTPSTGPATSSTGASAGWRSRWTSQSPSTRRRRRWSSGAPPRRRSLNTQMR